MEAWQASAQSTTQDDGLLGELSKLAYSWLNKYIPRHSSDHVVGIGAGYDMAAQELQKVIAKYRGK